MKKIFRKLNNSGATLVMVIVAMLFIGIISVAVLALAMGNFGNTQTVTKSSESFYTAETVNDSLKLCLQQYANKAAKAAYMEQLQNGVVEAAAFQTSFRNKFVDAINGKDGSAFLAEIQSNTNDALEGYTINIPYVSDPNFRTDFLSTGIIKNVEVIHVEEGTNYKTNLCSDFEISAVAPPLVYSDPDKMYAYDVDKYLFISDSNVSFGDNSDEMAGSNTAVGNIFANGDISVQAAAGANLNLSGKNIISSNKTSGKGNFIMNKGLLSISGFGKQFIDVHKTGSYEPIDNSNGNVWCDNFDIEKGTVSISTKTNLYLGDDLTLEGDGTAFGVAIGAEHGNDGGIIAYSTDGRASDADIAVGGSIQKATAHKNSGSIVINGKNAKLDLSNLNKLYLAGQAYTEVPDIAGSTNPTSMYFAQGESLTYKSLQSIYLVDGSRLYYEEGGERKYVGSNPMKEDDFIKWRDGGYYTDATVPNGVLSTDKFEFKSVQYSSHAIYYYVYWKFTDADYAVSYFNSVVSDALGKQKLSAIGTGFIKLPSDLTKVSSKGNLISYNGSNFDSVGGGLSPAASSECASAKFYYDNIKTSLSPEFSMDNGAASFDIFDNVLFAGGKLDLITSGKRTLDITSPVQDANNGVVAIEGGVAKKDTKTYSYKLIVSNSDLEFDSSDFNDTLEKYVIICKGSVTFNSVDFKGIVFAKGGVKICGTGNDFECLGNYLYKTTEGNIEYKSEFDALLSVNQDYIDANKGAGKYYGDTKKLDDGSILLRSIFGVSDDNGDSEENEEAYDFTNLKTVAIKINYN